ncbi:MAG: hypothetical protein LBS96_02570, partial [Oscillospiraceae bacterium]|nr:hypothetical protein [Oscillospiraceae bacterium]
MKAAKKILAAFCAAALCFTALAVTSLAAPAQTKLQYGADGKFKILTFTDTHLTAEDQSKMITF